MSDLSFLIQTQNQVQIDKGYLEQCQQDNRQQMEKQAVSGLSKLLASREIRLQKAKTQLQPKMKTSLITQKSFKHLFSDPTSTNPNLDFSLNKSTDNTMSSNKEKQELSKLTIRLEALEQNHNRYKEKIGAELFFMREDLERNNRQQYKQVEEVKRIREEMGQSRKKIGELLGLISQATKK